MTIWRDVGEAMAEAIAGDWQPEGYITFRSVGPGGMATAYFETPLGRQRRQQRFLAEHGFAD